MAVIMDCRCPLSLSVIIAGIVSLSTIAHAHQSAQRYEYPIRVQMTGTGTITLGDGNAYFVKAPGNGLGVDAQGPSRFNISGGELSVGKNPTGTITVDLTVDSPEPAQTVELVCSMSNKVEAMPLLPGGRTGPPMEVVTGHGRGLIPVGPVAPTPTDAATYSFDTTVFSFTGNATITLTDANAYFVKNQTGGFEIDSTTPARVEFGPKTMTMIGNTGIATVTVAIRSANPMHQIHFNVSNLTGAVDTDLTFPGKPTGPSEHILVNGDWAIDQTQRQTMVLATSAYASRQGPMTQTTQLTIPIGWGFGGSTVGITTADPTSPGKYWSIASGVKPGPDGRLKYAWVSATILVNETSGGNIWVGDQLVVMVARGRINPIVPSSSPPASPTTLPKIKTFTISPANAKVGDTITFSLTLDQPAPAGGYTVSISFQTIDGLTDTLVNVPTAMFIPAGQILAAPIVSPTTRVVDEVTTFIFTAACAANQVNEPLSIG